MSITASDGMEVSEARLGEEINLTPVLRYPDDVRYSKIKIDVITAITSVTSSLKSTILNLKYE